MYLLPYVFYKLYEVLRIFCFILHGMHSHNMYHINFMMSWALFFTSWIILFILWYFYIIWCKQSNYIWITFYCILLDIYYIMYQLLQILYKVYDVLRICLYVFNLVFLYHGISSSNDDRISIHSVHFFLLNALSSLYYEQYSIYHTTISFHL